jgi:hypothetical protein
MARSSSILGAAVAAVALAGWGEGQARGQSYGFGSSPGRASYRPPSQWNNGPYYTAPHVDPYAPRPAVWTGYIYYVPSLPPYGSEPHAPVTAFYAQQGTLYPYQQGFSPFSGYADWYERVYDFVPTERDLARAAVQYFRSSPIPADPSYIAPAVSQALYAPTVLVPGARPASQPAAAAGGVTRPKVEVPQTPPPPTSPRGPAVYRGLRGG